MVFNARSQKNTRNTLAYPAGGCENGIFPELRDAEFHALSKLVEAHAGISLHAGKEALVKARLGKRLRQLGIRSYREYLDYLRRDDGEEFVAMLDAISTNVTYFFREPEHFAFLARRVLPRLLPARAKQRRLRFWSAGCSSGEEPYSLAIVLREKVPEHRAWDMRILATDLSTRVLTKARQGYYESEKLRDIKPELLARYFKPEDDGANERYRVVPAVRELVRFARLNLMNDWPMKGPFDVIFCRNVMIYFERETRRRLVRKFWELLDQGGMLLIGHSESLNGIPNDFSYIAPTIYQKV